MQTPATLIDYVSALDIAIFVSVPLFLLLAVLVQEYFERKASQDGRRSEPGRPIWL